MIFDIYSFSDVCIQILPVVIFLSIIVSTLLGAFARHSNYGMQLLLIFSYLFCIGVVVHEGAHQMMCKIFGVKIRETRYFRVEQKKIGSAVQTNIGGYVQCESVHSIIAALFLGVAPLLVNGLLVALLYYFAPLWLETWYYGLIVYIAIALALGARPSREDLAFIGQAFQNHPGRGIFELGLLCIFGGLFCSLVIYQVELWIILTALIVFLGICIIQGRIKPKESQAGFGAN